jgi:hypothetical protein
VSQAKYADLQKLCNKNIIPPNYHAEYLGLPHNQAVVDRLAEPDWEEEGDD